MAVAPGLRRTVLAVALAVALLGTGACRLVGVNGGSCAGRTSSTQRSAPVADVQRVAGAGNTVAGDVRDAATNEPLRNASVEIRPGPYKAVADSTGNFFFFGVPSGPVTITAQRYDHLVQEARFNVDPDGGANVAFALQSSRCDSPAAPNTPPGLRPGTVPRPTPPRVP